MERRWDELNIPDDLPDEKEAPFSLEEILAEFGGGEKASAGVSSAASAPSAQPSPAFDSPQKALLVQQEKPGVKEPERQAKEVGRTESPALAPDWNIDQEEELQPPLITEEATGEDADSIYAGLRRLIQGADNYARQMYEDGYEEEEAAEEAEAEEEVLAEEGWWPFRFRRREREQEPDVPPEEMAQEYAKGLKSLRIRSHLVLVLCVLLCYMIFADHFSLPLPKLIVEWEQLPLQVMLGLHLIAILLGADVIAAGMIQFFTLRAGMEALVSLSCLTSFADGVSLLLGLNRGEMLPFCAVSAVALFFSMVGIRKKRLALRITCKCASSSAACYFVTGDPNKWSGQAAFTKHEGTLAGFTAQLRSPDCIQRIYAKLSPLLILAAALFGVMASVGRERPEYFLWNFSAILAASASFSGFLCFSQPFLALTKRLFQTGAALCGWPGIAATARVRGIVLTDGEFFPPGTTALNGIKIFGDFPVDKVVSCTASLIRASGSGLDKIFHELLRNQGAVYRRVDNLSYSDYGGLEAEIRGERILVGSAAFMDRMGVTLTQGLHVKNAVFTAIGGELAGIFAISYSASPNIRDSLYALLRSHLRPILATRNFSLTPAMLGQRFKISAQKMDYPAVERRRELSDSGQSHGEIATAVICRDGLPPYADAVLGAIRLRRAARISAVLTAAGSVAGSLLSFYLAFSAAYFSLTPANLLLFLLLWMVPTLLISGWVTRF